MYRNERPESISFFKGCMFGILFVIPLWVGAYALATWLITR